MIAFRGDAADATISRLLFHTIGLPSGYYIAGDEVPGDEKRTNSDLMALCGVLVTEPGTRYQCTNIGYGLFDEIVAQVAGENVKEFISRKIIEPLGLEKTRFFKSKPPTGMVATQNTPRGVLPITFDAEGYSSLFSTAEDLARFGMFHLKTASVGNRILSDSSIDLLWQHRDPNVAITTRRIGWDVQRDFGLITVQHGGGGPGIHNWLYLIPSENVVISILSNARYDSPKSDPVFKALISATLSESGREKFSPRAGRGWPRWPQLRSTAYSGRWAGHIRGPKGSCRVDIDFDREGFPRMRIEGESCGTDKWLSPSKNRNKGRGSLLWRFDACIPYLQPYAVHDEVIITIWPEGKMLIGSASAAGEKNFGRGENYVLPQYLELNRTPDQARSQASTMDGEDV